MNERTLVLVELNRPFDFQSPVPGEEFALLLIVQDDAVTEEEQHDLAEAFVAQGCRYACVWGHGASSWDDAIDEVSSHEDESGDREHPFVMTTWHDDPTPREAVAFFANSTTLGPDENSTEGFEPTCFIVVVLGGYGADVRVRSLLDKAFSA